MYQGTTPAITFTIPGIDISEMTPYVTFKYGNTLMTKSSGEVTTSYDEDTERSVVIVNLSQEETLAMEKGTLIAQCKFIDENGMVYATNKASIQIEDALLKEVITYGTEPEPEPDEEEPAGDENE